MGVTDTSADRAAVSAGALVSAWAGDIMDREKADASNVSISAILFMFSSHAVPYRESAGMFTVPP
ncbi:hypothetical protein [Actinophytocola xinjiangensis]|uniref:hypothetical protein n=1 Tax=Actinophytocola xinjiangensis TaxID=485602 RepID=UPI0012B7DA0A|nr:hypothetical protein [Actinophytocola xinjiangensis]